MATVKLKIKNTEGVSESVTVQVIHEKMKTLRNGATFTDGHLAKLASKGKLSDEELTESPALINITQAQALEMIEEAFLNGSNNFEQVAEAPKAKPKVKSEEASEEGSKSE